MKSPLDVSSFLMTFLMRGIGEEVGETKVPPLTEGVRGLRNVRGVPAEEPPRLTGGTNGEQIDLRNTPSPHNLLKDFREKTPIRNDLKSGSCVREDDLFPWDEDGENP